MHELGVTQAIVEGATEACRGKKITRLVVEIGTLSMVMPDAVRFCFDLCSEGTLAEGAELEIREIPARARCRSCREESMQEVPFGMCSCGGELDWIAGRELNLKEMEVV